MEPQHGAALRSTEAWREQVKTLGASPGPLVKEYAAEITRAPGVDADRVRRFTITTGNPDRQHDVVTPSGWKLDNYAKNPVVLWAHDYKSLPIGRALSITNTGSGLVADVEFPPKDLHPFADTVLGLIDFGALKATSVGFDPIKYVQNAERGGFDFVEQELLEFSVVPVPANAEALQMAHKELGESAFGLYRGWIEETAKALRAPVSGCSQGAQCQNPAGTPQGCPMSDCPMRQPHEPGPRAEAPPAHYASLEAFFRDTAPIELPPEGFATIEDFLRDTTHASLGDG